MKSMKQRRIKWFVVLLVALIGTLLLTPSLPPLYRPAARRIHNVNIIESVTFTMPTTVTNR
jgi:hypothetical protein